MIKKFVFVASFVFVCVSVVRSSCDFNIKIKTYCNLFIIVIVSLDGDITFSVIIHYISAVIEEEHKMMILLRKLPLYRVGTRECVFVYLLTHINNILSD